MKIFGGSLNDYWDKIKHKYDVTVDLELEPSPITTKILPPETELMIFNRPELTINIGGTKQISTTNISALKI